MAAYSLNISCSPYNIYEKRNIRVQIKCISAIDESDSSSSSDDSDSSYTGYLDPNVFAYRLIAGEYIFDHVCSTVDMVEYPVPTGTSNGEAFKWCRKDTVDIVVRALSIAEDFIYNVKSDVQLLYQNMLAHNTLVGEEIFAIGDVYTKTVDQNSDWVDIDTIPTDYTYSLIQPSNAGSLQITTTTPKKIQYKPAKDVYGEEVFSYTLTDTEGTTNSYTYKITILQNGNKNVAQTAIYTLNTPLNITYTALTDVTTWLTGTDKEISIYDTTSEKSGIITKLNSSTLKYTPPTGYTDYDSFKYIVTDGKRYATINCTLNTTSN